MKALKIEFCDACPFYDNADPTACGESEKRGHIVIPGPDCPLPDVPEMPNTLAESQYVVALAKIDDYKRACISLVERLRGGK